MEIHAKVNCEFLQYIDVLLIHYHNILCILHFLPFLKRRKKRQKKALKTKQIKGFAECFLYFSSYSAERSFWDILFYNVKE